MPRFSIFHLSPLSVFPFQRFYSLPRSFSHSLSFYLSNTLTNLVSLPFFIKETNEAPRKLSRKTRVFVRKYIRLTGCGLYVNANTHVCQWMDVPRSGRVRKIVKVGVHEVELTTIKVIKIADRIILVVEELPEKYRRPWSTQCGVGQPVDFQPVSSFQNSDNSQESKQSPENHAFYSVSSFLSTSFLCSFFVATAPILIS